MRIRPLTLTALLLLPLPAAGARFVEPPTLTPNPNKAVPNAAILKFRTDEPAAVTVTADRGDRQWTLSFPATADPSAGLPIVGLPAGHDYRLTVRILGRSGEAAAGPLTWTTPRPPAPGLAWPGLERRVEPGATLEPGLTFTSIRRRAPGRQSYQTRRMQEFARSWGLILAWDERGEIVWWMNTDRRAAGVRPLPDGNILFNTEDFRTNVTDLLGNPLIRLYAEKRPQGPFPGGVPVKGLATLHHEPALTPRGAFISMSANPREIPNYYTSVTDAAAPRQTQKVMGDTIVEFDRSGKLLWEWDTFDYLDPMRVNFHLFEPYWTVRGFPGYLDWSHGNGIAFDAKTGTVIASFKHQDALVGIDYRTKRIRWIFADPEGWPPHLAKLLLKPVGEVRYPWAAHHPEVTAEGTIVFYDNGHLQARPFTGKQPVEFGKYFSRAAEVRIDEKARTVTEVWASERELTADSCVHWAMGEAQRLPLTGNMLVVRAFCPPLDAGLQDFSERDRSRRFVDDVVYGARVEEYGRTPARLLTRTTVEDPNGVLQWQIYGGFHVPGIQWADAKAR